MVTFTPRRVAFSMVTLAAALTSTGLALNHGSSFQPAPKPGGGGPVSHPTAVSPAVAGATSGGTQCSVAALSSNGIATARYNSCIINGTSGTTASAIARVSFTASDPTAWSACTIDVSLRDDTIGTTVDDRTYDCTSLARTNNYTDDFGYLANAIPGHRYHTYLRWSGTYDTTTFPESNPANSPEIAAGSTVVTTSGCRIDVRANPVAAAFSHLYVIYVDQKGTSYYFRGGPANNFVPFGPIRTKTGIYEPGSTDWNPNAPSTTALAGSVACGKDICFTSQLNRINTTNTGYWPQGPNSNSVAYTILSKCDVPTVRPVTNTPGWGMLV